MGSFVYLEIAVNAMEDVTNHIMRAKCNVDATASDTEELEPLPEDKSTDLQYQVGTTNVRSVPLIDGKE